MPFQLAEKLEISKAECQVGENVPRPGCVAESKSGGECVDEVETKVQPAEDAPQQIRSQRVQLIRLPLVYICI